MTTSSYEGLRANSDELKMYTTGAGRWLGGYSYYCATMKFESQHLQELKVVAACACNLSTVGRVETGGSRRLTSWPMEPKR